MLDTRYLSPNVVLFSSVVSDKIMSMDELADNGRLHHLIMTARSAVHAVCTKQR